MSCPYLLDWCLGPDALRVPTTFVRTAGRRPRGSARHPSGVAERGAVHSRRRESRPTRRRAAL